MLALSSALILPPIWYCLDSAVILPRFCLGFAEDYNLLDGRVSAPDYNLLNRRGSAPDYNLLYARLVCRLLPDGKESAPNYNLLNRRGSVPDYNSLDPPSRLSIVGRS